MRIEVPFAGLSNSKVPRRVGFGGAYSGYNCTRRRACLEAREGFLQRWIRPTSPNAPDEDDVALGFGYGKYADSEVMVYVVLPNSNTYAHVYVHDLATDSTRHFGLDDRWTRRDPTRWRFVQYDNFIYMVNEVDGLWRLDITDTTAEALTQVDITLSSLVVATAGVSVADQYTAGSWSTMTPDAAILVDPTDYGTFAPNTSTITAAGLWKLDQTDGLDGRYDGYWWFTGVFGTPIDCSAHRYWLLNPQIPETTDAKPLEDFVFVDWTGRTFQFWWTDDATPTYGAPWTGWYKCEVSYKYVGWNDRAAQHWPNNAVCIIDFDKFLKDYGPSVPITSVTAIAFGLPVGGANNGYAIMPPPKLGGAWLAKPSADAYLKADDRAPWGAESVDYAVTFYDATGGAGGTPIESAAAFKTLAKKDTAGLYQDDIIAGGATVQISLPAPDAGYAVTRLYRRRRSDSNKWYLLKETAVASVETDTRVDWIDDPTDWNEVSIESAGYQFGTGVRQELAPQFVAVWKTHLVLAVGQEVYFSEAQDPSSYAQPLRATSTSGEVDTTTQETSPRTLYVANNIGEKVLSIIPHDMLYAATEGGLYAMVGDSAATASPFRKLPGARWPINPEAMCAYKSGVVVAAQDGVFYYEASRAIAVSDDTSTYIEDDLTKGDLKESYKWLLNGSTNPVIVQAVGNEIYVIRGSFHLVRRDDGAWERGAWNHTALQTDNGDIGPNDGGDPEDDDPWEDPSDDPGDDDPGGGDSPNICYDDPALFSITQEWTGTTTTDSTVTVADWNTGAGDGSSQEMQASDTGPGPNSTKSRYATCTGTVTFTVQYIGAGPSPTHVHLLVDGSVVSEVSSNGIFSGGTMTSSATATATNGLGTTPVVDTNTGGTNLNAHYEVHATGQRSFTVAMVDNIGVLNVHASAYGIVTVNSGTLFDGTLDHMVTAAYSATIDECPDYDTEGLP